MAVCGKMDSHLHVVSDMSSCCDSEIKTSLSKQIVDIDRSLFDASAIYKKYRKKNTTTFIQSYLSRTVLVASLSLWPQAFRSPQSSILGYTADPAAAVARIYHSTVAGYKIYIRKYIRKSTYD
jgi:hypothetical protein